MTSLSLNLKKVGVRLLNVLPTLFVNPKTEILLNDVRWITKLCNTYSFLCKIYPNYSVRHFLHSYIETVHKQISKGKITEEEIVSKWINAFKDFDDDDCFFLTKILFESGFLSEPAQKAIIQYAYDTHNPLRRYTTVMDISMQIFRWGQQYYPSFYNDRKKLLNQIACEICHKPDEPECSVKQKRLCIVTYMLGANLFNSVQRVACMIANNLAKQYDEILVVSLETFNLQRNELRTAFYSYRQRSSQKIYSQCKAMFAENVEVFIPDSVTYKEKNQLVLNKIYAFHPDSIIDISDEMSALSNIYSKDFPVYYIPMRNNATSISFSYIMGRLWKYEEGNKRFNSIDPAKVKDWMFPEFVPERKKDYTKAEIGVSEDSFIMLSIGNNDKTYSRHLLDMICELLNENPKIVWLLVGNDAPQYVKEKYGSLISSKRIIEWGFERNLIGICVACDVHIRSNMTGGSGATAIACQAGLPVVMTDFLCDPMRWLGRDFSSLRTDEDMIAEIKHLYQDKGYYQQQSKRVQELVNRAVDADYWWSKLYELINAKDNEVNR